MRILALDVGGRRTGIAYLDTEVGIALPLPTVSHTSKDGLLAAVQEVIRMRGITKVVVGLPKLPDGTEGAQAAVSREVGERLRGPDIEVVYKDERFTSPTVRSAKRDRHSPPPSSYDGDAAAACALLQ